MRKILTMFTAFAVTLALAVSASAQYKAWGEGGVPQANEWNPPSKDWLFKDTDVTFPAGKKVTWTAKTDWVGNVSSLKPLAATKEVTPQAGNSNPGAGNSGNSFWGPNIPNVNSNTYAGVFVAWTTDKGETNGNTTELFLKVAPEVFDAVGGSFTIRWQQSKDYYFTTITATAMSSWRSADGFYYYRIVTGAKGNSSVNQVWLQLPELLPPCTCKKCEAPRFRDCGGCITCDGKKCKGWNCLCEKYPYDLDEVDTTKNYPCWCCKCDTLDKGGCDHEICGGNPNCICDGDCPCTWTEGFTCPLFACRCSKCVCEPAKGEIPVLLKKTVDGLTIDAWAKVESLSDDDLWKIFSDITFSIYTEDDILVGGPVALTDIGYLDDEMIFSISEDDLPGWFYVVETIGPDAEEFFKPMPGPQWFWISKSGAVTDDIVDFDYDALYTIVNGYSGRYIKALGYPGLNNTGDIFYIGVTNEETGEEYPSFCAHAGSKNFAGDAGHGCAGYLVTDTFGIENTTNRNAFLSAFNYIYDTYGDLNTERVITQVVIWALLEAIDVDSAEFDDANLTDDEYTAIKDVIANYAGYKGNGLVVDAVYMLCETHGDTEFGLENCQPQIVPIYGEPATFDNKTGPEETPTFNVSFKKTKYGGLLPVGTDEFAFVLGKWDETGVEGAHYYYYDTCKTDANGVVTATALTPGDYVFVEVLATFYPLDGNDWEFIWDTQYPGGADGLYFTIDAKGVATWRDTDEAVPTVDNILLNKAYALWSEVDQPWGDQESLGEGKGWIFYPNGRDNAEEEENGGRWLKWEYLEPDCTTGGIIYFYYGANREACGSIDTGEDAFGHQWVLYGDGLSCFRCWKKERFSPFIEWWTMDEELLALYYELGGMGGLE